MLQKLLFLPLLFAYCWLTALCASGQSLAFAQSQLIGVRVNAGSTTVDSQVSDQVGNVYTAGSFNGTITLGTTTLSSAGNFDVFICKQDAGGNYLWVKQISGASFEAAPRLAVDATNRVFVAAQTQSASLQLGAITLNTTQADLVVAQLDASGNFTWAVKAGNSPTTSGTQLMAVAVDASNNLCLTGYFSGSVSFGTTVLNGAGGSDAFVVKISSAGTWAWAIRIGGNNNDAGRGLAIDSTGNIYLTGSFAGYLGTDPGVAFGSTTFYSGNSGTDIFVAKLTAAGTFVWAVRAGGADASDDGYGLTLDTAGNPYITGNFSRTATFGTLSLTSAGNFDVFVAKLNSAGNFLWATRAGGPDYDYGDRLISQDNELYLAGHYFSTTTLGTSTFNSVGQTDIVLCQLSDSGNILSAVGAGSTGTDLITSLRAGGNSQVYASGYFLGANITFGATTLSGQAAVNKGFVVQASSGGSPLAVQSGVQLQPLAAWPNPTSSAFELANVDTKQAVEVYDTQGRLVMEYRSHDTPAGAVTLPEGLYLVRNGSRTIRVTVN